VWVSGSVSETLALSLFQRGSDSEPRLILVRYRSCSSILSSVTAANRSGVRRCDAFGVSVNNVAGSCASQVSSIAGLVPPTTVQDLIVE
jgi:hypothetical protein